LSLDIVSIARQLSAEWILPTSFYRICQSSFDREIVMGPEFSDAGGVACIKGLRCLETTGAARVLDPGDVCLGWSDMKMLHDEAREEP
jgi:hypothetical protein